MTISRLTGRQSMGAAALLMAASVFLSRIMGLVRDKIISWQFGAGADTDVYFAAFVIPDFINYLLAGGYMSMILVPLLSGFFGTGQEDDGTDGEKDGWNFFSTVICWNTLAICLLALLGVLFAGRLAALTAPGFTPEQSERLAGYLRIILPGQIFFLAGACLTALLYTRKSFTVPALTPLVYNAAIIISGLLWPALFPSALPDMTGYAAGASAGAAVGAFALPLRAAMAGGLHLRPRLTHPLLRRYIRLALPLMLGQSIVVLDEQLLRVFGSLGGEGLVSLLNYARRLMLVPVGVVAQAAGLASFPFLAGLAARNDCLAFMQTLRSALRSGLHAVVPVTAWMMAAAGPLLGLVFEGGRFGAENTAQAAPLLRILLLGVPFWLIQQVMGRAFYARQDTLTPAALGTLVTLAALPAYALAARHWPGAGLAALSAASIALYALLLCLWWRKRFGAAAFVGLGGHALRPVLAACFAACAAWLAMTGASPLVSGFLARPDVLPRPLLAPLTHTSMLALSALVFLLAYLPPVYAPALRKRWSKRA